MSHYEVPDDKILIFALTYCPYCKESRTYLAGKGYGLIYVQVDELEDGEREEALKEVKACNPRSSFPTIIFGDTGEVVVGFEPEEIDAALKVFDREYPNAKKKS